MINDSKKGRWKQCLNQKKYSIWPSPALTHPQSRRHWCTEAAMTAWSSLAHSNSYAVLEVVENRDQSCVFCTPYPVVFRTPFSQLDLNPANLEVTLQAEWIMAFLFFRKRHFSVTSQLGHHYVMSWKYWWDILQFFSHTDCQDNSCQKFYKFLGHGVCKRTICTPPWVCLRIIFIHNV